MSIRQPVAGDISLNKLWYALVYFGLVLQVDTLLLVQLVRDSSVIWRKATSSISATEDYRNNNLLYTHRQPHCCFDHDTCQHSKR